jgi:hypothetical protein
VTAWRVPPAPAPKGSGQGSMGHCRTARAATLPGALLVCTR